LTILVIRRLTRRVMAATALGARPARRPTALQLVVVEPLRRLVAPCRTPRGTHSNGRSTAGSRFNHPRPIPFRQGTCDDRARAPAPDAAFIGRAIGAAKEMTAMASEGRRERYLRNDSGTSGANRAAAAGHSCTLPLQTTSVRIPLPSSTVGRHLHADPGARRAPGVEVCGDARRREAPERSWRQGVAALRAARRRLRWRGWPRRNAVRLSRCGPPGNRPGGPLRRHTARRESAACAVGGAAGGARTSRTCAQARRLRPITSPWSGRTGGGASRTWMRRH
jgi:hypothetical protein